MSQTDTRWSGIPGALRQIGGRHVRLTVVTAALVLVVAGAAAGYAGHRPSRPAGSLRAASSIARAPAGPTAIGAAGSSAASGGGAIACPMVGGPVDAIGGDGSVGHATHLFTRTTTDGVTIRSYRLSSTGSCVCDATPSLSLEMSDATAVGEGGLFDTPGPVATTANATSEPIASTSGTFGVTEGAPVWWAAATVGPEVANVTMTFADGSTDQMSPVDGVAVLAHQIDVATASSPNGPYEVRGTMTLFDAHGAVMKTVTFPAASPAPVPLPVTVPGSPPTPVADGGSSNHTPTSGPSMNGSMTACAEVVPPTEAMTG